jgi:SAM-dependent methyltransferase
MTKTEYVLGHDADELRRLELQARVLAPPTNTILDLAGIGPGMRVLDLGTGIGDVAFAAAGKVGPSGAVLGIDRSPEALAIARGRAADAGLGNVSFVDDDLADPTVDGEFDAVVGRLVLLYVERAEEVVRRFASLLTPGGVFVAMEYEMTAAGMLPRTAIADSVIRWIVEAFRASGLDPSLGARLGGVLRRGGLDEPTVVGLQGYLEPGNPAGPRLAASTVRTLLPAIERSGIASVADVDIDSLEARLAAALVEHDAVFKPPTLVGAWACVQR